MINAVQILELFTILGVILRVPTAYNYGYVVYRAYKETGVKNGLIELRNSLFNSSMLLFAINLISLALLLLRIFDDNSEFILFTNFLSILNSIAFYVDSQVKKTIYTASYSEEQKDLHSRIDILENAEKAHKIDKSKKK